MYVESRVKDEKVEWNLLQCVKSNVLKVSKIIFEMMKVIFVFLIIVISLIGGVFPNQEQAEQVEDTDGWFSPSTPAPVDYSLSCPVLKKSTYYPNDIYSVRPVDIKVVLAVGDSLSAAFGLTYHGFGSYVGESRGKSWSIGGDPKTPSIPNFLAAIGANTTGQSFGRSLPLLHFFPTSMREIARSPDTCHKLNGAMSTAILNDVPEQIEYLADYIDEIKPTVDIIRDWKLLNYYIGNNDICDSCEGKNTSTVAFYKDNYYNSLLSMRKSFPRMIVNVILIPNHISEIANMGKGEMCSVMRDKIMRSCTCALSDDGKKVMDQRSKDLNQVILKAVNDINEDSKTKNIQFRAVVQPFLTETHVKRNFVSEFDCFHFNEYGGRLAAVGLWNNMMQTTKSDSINEFDKPICPSESTYLVSV
ncbi:phospholamban [Cavenderia fasciculata]|uniref:Phospholamban n=1 Tax=Cavenderia fasciculata TaxID=261658 RepID=F4QB75_CACFS|nr:phospholamban [Cavenderia fasciculata]EGG14847.1 phospholamban [Cavenderia fasciculata]|eukprot:XP_004351363.1 phospholamban [Cavenderia fasciculata]